MKNYSYLICDTAPITSGVWAKMYLCNLSLGPVVSDIHLLGHYFLAAAGRGGKIQEVLNSHLILVQR